MPNYVALPILVEPNTGGWISYTAHLAEGLIAAGYTPIILKTANRTETMMRPFTGGLVYLNATLDEITAMAAEMPTIITAVGKNHRHHLPALLKAGASLVIHDPTELDKEFAQTLTGADIITIRQIISDRLNEQGLTNRYTPHPYHRIAPYTADKTLGTISLSRIDWDKRTHTIVEANQLLETPVSIYGKLNTQYEFHKLTPTDPDWRRNYAGQWSPREPLGYPVELARRATQVIDLSVIKGDGGGTQYSFLETFDAGTPLIIHQDWLTGNPRYDEIRDAAIPIRDAQDLADAVRNPRPYNHEAAATILANHEAGKVATMVLNKPSR